jgi:hypothetical protein
MRFLFPPIRRTLGGSKGIPGFHGLLISSVAIRDVRHRRGATWDPLHENINGRGSFRARRCSCVYADEPNTTARRRRVKGVAKERGSLGRIPRAKAELLRIVRRRLKPIEGADWVSQSQTLLAHAVAAAHRHDEQGAKAAAQSIESLTEANPRM